MSTTHAEPRPDALLGEGQSIGVQEVPGSFGQQQATAQLARRVGWYLSEKSGRKLGLLFNHQQHRELSGDLAR